MGLPRTISEINSDFCQNRNTRRHSEIRNYSGGATRPRKKFDDIFTRLDTIHECDGHRPTANTALTHIRIPSRGKKYFHNGPIQRPSKSYLTPPRWRGLGNGSTPVSHHITTRLRRVDENVDPAKFRLCSAFPHLGFGVPCWCGVGGPGLGSALLVS